MGGSALDVRVGRTREKRWDVPLRVKGSTTRFLMPFFPLERRLFLPTAVQRPQQPPVSSAVLERGSYRTRPCCPVLPCP